MKIFNAGAEVIGKVGFGVIKNSFRTVYGGGQALVGVLTESEDLVEQGIRNTGRGVAGLGANLIVKSISEGTSEDIEEFDYEV